jgi:spore coat protein U-like protein
LNNLTVDVGFELWAETIADPPRQMRDIGATGLTVGYDMYIDPARTRLWGSGVAPNTFPLQGACSLDDRNRVCTVPYLLYGTVYGGQQQVPPGNFQGAILARLSYFFSGCRT